jgi:N-acetyl-1-D-myo-inositol-2-amino-2-deoxy-alpha-D-glucopyranoside deacetylase
VIVAPSGTEYALSNLIAQPIGTAEHFIRTDVDSPEFESDLFEGIR